MVFILYLFFILPESLSKRRIVIARQKHELWKSSRDGMGKRYLQTMHPMNLVRPLSVLFPTGPGSSPRLRSNLMLLAASDTILFGVGIGAMTVTVLYGEMKFGWGDVEVWLLRQSRLVNK